jgi:hypothetical protein
MTIIEQQTRQIQIDLANYCKTGDYKPLPGITPNRIHHYRRLVFNIVKNTLEQAFPLTCDILDKDLWDNTVSDFFADHNPQSPQVWKLPFEFYEWAIEENLGNQLDIKYLNDLLLFEWIEIEVFMMPDIDFPDFAESGDIITDIQILNPEFRLIELKYPVHKVAVNNLHQYEGQYYLLVFREPRTKKVEFVELSALHVFILDRILNQELSLADILLEAIEVFHLQNKQGIKSRLEAFFYQLIEKGFVLGFRQV